MLCPLCRKRQAKRACPGTGQTICTVCCGTKRRKEIACPPTCVYLESAQRHPAAVVVRQQENDLRTLAATLGPVSEEQLQLFFLIHTFVAQFKPSSLSPLTDSDLAEAAGALAESFETAGRGIVYEPQAASMIGEHLRRELKTSLAEVGRGRSNFEAQAAQVLRGIERGAKHDAPGIGADARAYLTLVARLINQGSGIRDQGSGIRDQA